jgi:hypothetical protein
MKELEGRRAGSGGNTTVMVEDKRQGEKKNVLDVL